MLCCSFFLGRFERSGGVAGCFKCVGLAREVSLATEAQLVVVCGKVPVDFELDLLCLPLKHIDVIFGMD